MNFFPFLFSAISFMFLMPSFLIIFTFIIIFNIFSYIYVYNMCVCEIKYVTYNIFISLPLHFPVLR